MVYLYDAFYALWQSLFGTNFTDDTVMQLLAVVSVIGFVGWILRIIGGLKIFRGSKK